MDLIDFRAVFFDALWILGLAGVLATLSYTDWYRLQKGWRWRTLWDRPCFVVPLSVSLLVFCVGVALSGATAYTPDPWWQTALWALLALLFAVQAGIYARAGMRHGWDVPVGEVEGSPQRREEHREDTEEFL